MIDNPEMKLKSYITLAERLISSDALCEIMHYYNHDEFEMAYEGLVIELMNSDKYPDVFCYSDWRELALCYKLDTDFVFDEQFWDKFTRWGENYKTE